MSSRAVAQKYGSSGVLGVRFGFALLLLLVIAVLIWRPSGIFGKSRVVRL